MCIDTNGNPEGPRKAKVGQFDDPVVVNEQVLWLEISVNNSTLMAVQDSLCDLMQVTL